MNIESTAMDYFEKICSIPHGSGNTERLAEYCCGVAEKLGLWYKKDAYNNVIIKKNAGQGMQNREPVIIQGHLDMVCAKEDGCKTDFEKEGIKIVREGDFLRAQGTTLGGDDAVAVAYALAILSDDKTAYPPLEVIFTSDEETGMDGALNIDLTEIKGRRLINIDSEEEGIFTAGCAGGARADILFELKKTAVNGKKIRITAGGLTGGHSGTQINLGGLNANKVAAELLYEICQKYGANIISFNGGEKDNAIPVKAEAFIAVTADKASMAESLAQSLAEKIKANAKADPDIYIDAEVIGDYSGEAFCEADSKRVSEAFFNFKNGVISMDENADGLVKTSLNLGVLKTDEGGISAVISTRSNSTAELCRLNDDLKCRAEKYGAKFALGSEYPAWEYVKKSPLRDVMSEVYRRQYGSEPVVTCIHAGLECGIFAGKLKGLDAVSIGPEIYDIHTARERLSVPSFYRVLNFLTEVLKEL